MKYLVIVLFLGVAFAQTTAPKAKEDAAAPAAAKEDGEPKPRIFRRFIPADVLRDFPNYCFASTSCKLYEDGQDWLLTPFCGRSHCMFDERAGRFYEVVFDCGPQPLNKKDCTVLKTGNKTATFPDCCDVYELDTCQFPDLKGPSSGPDGEQQSQPIDSDAPRAPAAGAGAESTGQTPNLRGQGPSSGQGVRQPPQRRFRGRPQEAADQPAPADSN